MFSQPRQQGAHGTSTAVRTNIGRWVALPSEDWMELDWDKLELDIFDLDMSPKQSPVQLLEITPTEENKTLPTWEVHVKRDDQLIMQPSQLTGNKARKLWSLNQLLLLKAKQQFPKSLVSYGGPQSNAMLAMAQVVHARNQQQQKENSPNPLCRFFYYTKPLPRFLRESPNGNFQKALDLGMEIVELSHEEYHSKFHCSGKDGDCSRTLDSAPLKTLLPAPTPLSLWIPQGGACGAALAGTRQLAREILGYWRSKHTKRPLAVCLPGGTCSTAVLLHDALQQEQLHLDAGDKDMIDVRVVVIPCVGDASYAQKQMNGLNKQLGLSHWGIPHILPPSPSETHGKDRQHFRFGEPNAQVLETFRYMRDKHGLTLDLLYGAPSWTMLLQHLRQLPRIWSPLSGRGVMYVHSGGLEGICSQLQRYRYKGLWNDDNEQDLDLVKMVESGGA